MLTLSNDNLLAAVRKLVTDERRLTRNILDHINEVDQRRLHVELGYSSIFEWLVKDLGYSESAAYRRMQAARLIRAVPGAAVKVESGELGLSVLAKVQTMIRAEEKRTCSVISQTTKTEILAKVESCSAREAEVHLASQFPDSAPSNVQEKVHAIGQDLVRVELTFTSAQFEKLKRIEELLSHTHLGSSKAALIETAMDVFLEKKDPLRRDVAKPRQPQPLREPAHSEPAPGEPRFGAPPSTQSNTAAALKIGASSADVSVAEGLRKNFNPIGTARQVRPSQKVSVFKNSGGRCEYIDSKTKRRCESRHLLEIDHIQPRARGGTNELQNLRILCRSHNLFAAQKIFGESTMARFRSTLSPYS